MTQALEIVNHALVLLGEQPLISLEQPGKQAKVVKALYSIIRDSELASHPWHFAKKRQLLSCVSLDELPKGNDYYLLPCDWLQTIALFHQGYEVPYVRYEGSYIVTENNHVLELLYIARIEDSHCYPALFKESLALKLAYSMADSLTANSLKAENLKHQYEAAYKKAKHANALIAPPATFATTHWIAQRG